MSWKHRIVKSLILFIAFVQVNTQNTGMEWEVRLALWDQTWMNMVKNTLTNDSAFSPAIDHLRAEADKAMKEGAYSVTFKSLTPPGGTKHDYMSMGPYWWPDPERPDGLPYVRRDGERVPGTLMYEPDSDRYDRTRVQLLFDDGLALALSWLLTGGEDHGILATFPADAALPAGFRRLGVVRTAGTAGTAGTADTADTADTEATS